MSRISRGDGKVKKWKTRVYCMHSGCLSNTRDAIPGILMIPFKKPCNDFYRNIVDPENVPHDPIVCDQCSKILKWINLCQRGDKKTSLTDLKHQSYICSKHFYDDSGPTDECPDPFPADKSEDEIAQLRMEIRRRLESKEEEKRKAVGIVDTLVTYPDTEFPNETTAGNFEQVVVKMENGDTDQYQLFDGTFSFDNVAKMLFKHNFAIKNNSESIQVTILEGFRVEIQPTLDIDINVYGKTIPNEHEVWTTLTRKSAAKNDEEWLVAYLQSLQRWRICEAFEKAQIASRFREAFGEDAFDSIGATLALDLAETCHILSRKARCANCKGPLGVLRQKIARKARREDQRMSSMINVSEESEPCAVESQRKSKVKMRKVERHSEISMVAAGDFEVRATTEPVSEASKNGHVIPGELFKADWDFES